MRKADKDGAKRAVVTVGKGRGFSIEATLHGRLLARLIITAAHCLPHLPPALATAYSEERTYAGLLGLLNDREPKVWTECIFVDPVADIAVLAEPDNQALCDEADAYNKLTEEVPPLRIADASKQGVGWLLTLDGLWISCVVRHNGGPIKISDAAEPIMGGMSGSPVLNSDGSAVGVVCCSSSSGDKLHTEGYPNPKLMDSLPGYLLRGIGNSD